MPNPSVHLRFDAQTHPNADLRVAAWRDAYSHSVDTGVKPDQIPAFAGSMRFTTLGAVLLVDIAYTAHSVVRTRETIVRTGQEHVIFDVFLAGGGRGTAEGRALTIHPGDGLMLNLRGTLRLQLPAGRFIGVVIPRGLFEARAGAGRMGHGQVLPAASAEIGFLTGLLLQVAEQADRLPEPLAAALGDGLIGLVAACCAEPARATRPAVPATPARLRRYIDRHAHERDLDPARLGRDFALSRTALYRLFHREGGVAEIIRRRRAALAVQALAEPDRRDRSLEDIARGSGFPDARGLRRALRTVYDVTPGEIRADPQATSSTGRPSLTVGALLDDLLA